MGVGLRIMETKLMSFRDTIILAMSERNVVTKMYCWWGKMSEFFGGLISVECRRILVQNVFVTSRFLRLRFQVRSSWRSGLRSNVDMTFHGFLGDCHTLSPNQAAKTRYMFAEGQVPMTVRFVQLVTELIPTLPIFESGAYPYLVSCCPELQLIRRKWLPLTKSKKIDFLFMEHKVTLLFFLCPLRPWYLSIE